MYLSVPVSSLVKWGYIANSHLTGLIIVGSIKWTNISKELNSAWYEVITIGVGSYHCLYIKEKQVTHFWQTLCLYLRTDEIILSSEMLWMYVTWVIKKPTGSLKCLALTSHSLHIFIFLNIPGPRLQPVHLPHLIQDQYCLLGRVSWGCVGAVCLFDFASHND